MKEETIIQTDDREYNRLNDTYEVLKGLFEKYKNSKDYDKMLQVQKIMKLIDEEQSFRLKELQHQQILKVNAASNV